MSNRQFDFTPGRWSRLTTRTLRRAARWTLLAALAGGTLGMSCATQVKVTARNGAEQFLYTLMQGVAQELAEQIAPGD
ncbi:MAG TPA: hypothetical protein PKK06_02845 [Phycisphaerae bacterium]|nr:hypothetical protein [Phycisphaerae bacterium]HNU44623.1 hypothetical protein [Phycisphaerae bacterium]